ncbi:MAG: hypothetical protein C0627_09675 [Sulfurimonas sp.]|nr:MAG: hypothetical protein C0627_09675 [Sulfurimonas sp.]
MYGLTNSYTSLPRKDNKKYDKEKIYFMHLDAAKKWVLKTNRIQTKIENNLAEEKTSIESSNSIFIHDIKKVY